MHFLTSYPKFQSIVFEDPRMHQIKEEINISKLDLLVIVELLRFTSLSESVSATKLSKCLAIIEEFRVLLGTETADHFWENLSMNKTGSPLNDHQKSWNDIWRDSKSSLIRILRFLKDREELKESTFSKHIEEIRLFETWTKQEIIQNWNGAIERQIKSLRFLRNKKALVKNSEEAVITVCVSDDQNGIRECGQRESGILSSVLSYLGSFFYSWDKQDVAKRLSLQDVSLDSWFATILDSKMKVMVKTMLSEQAFVDVSLVEVSKGKRAFFAPFSEASLSYIFPVYC